MRLYCIDGDDQFLRNLLIGMTLYKQAQHTLLLSRERLRQQSGSLTVWRKSGE
jgi:hypothetical protein